MKRIVVAGIHTEVGKTVVSTLLANALGAAYWKPVQCGLPSDCEWVQKQSSILCYPSMFVLQAPVSPHLAAKKEGLRIRAGDLRPPNHSGVLVIEGTGGILSPLNEEEVWADAAIHWEAAWVLVHRHYLGSLNHFLLTVEALRQRNIPLWGVVFNGEGDLATEEMLLKRAKTQCLGRLAWERSWTKKRIQKVSEKWTGLLGI